VKDGIGCIYLNGALGCVTTIALLVENVTVDWMLILITRSLKWQYGQNYGETCSQGDSKSWCCGKSLLMDDIHEWDTHITPNWPEVVKEAFLSTMTTSHMRVDRKEDS